MKKVLYSFLLACIIMLLCPSNTQAQEQKIFFMASQGLYFINKDGTGLTKGPRYISQLTQASNGDLYGSKRSGEGQLDGGAVFRMTADGVEDIHPYEGYGESSYASVVEGDDGYFYGISPQAGCNKLNSSIFKFKPDGSDFQRSCNLPDFFSNGDIINTQAGGVYGVSSNGGINGKGFIYKIPSQLQKLDTIHSFSTALGKRPVGKLMEGKDGYLYGITESGGASNYGVIYKIKPDGMDYTIIHHFNKKKGSSPVGGLVQDGNGFIYGWTKSGGKYISGVIFKIKPDGTEYTTIYDMGGLNGIVDGGGLAIDDQGDLYGSLRFDKINYVYSMFRLKSDGTGFTKLITFDSYFFPSSKLLFVKQPYIPNILVSNPTNGATHVNTSLDISVNHVPGALDYTIELSESADFSTINFSTSSEDTLLHINGLNGETLYYARAKSSVWPYFGNATSFTTGTAKKIWGVLDGNPGKVYNINIDGSNYTDYFEPVEEDSRGEIIENIFKLNEGGLIAVTSSGGATRSGTIIKINSAGLTKLHDWESYPFGGNTSVVDGNDGYIYGVGIQPSSNAGFVFKIKTDGSNYENNPFAKYGFWPAGNLVKASNGIIYGMSIGNGPGWIYKIKPDYSGITQILTFSNATGKKPRGGLIEVGGYLYGMTHDGGAYKKGTIFKVRLDATGFVKLHDFNVTQGLLPSGDLLYDGTNTLYGTTSIGGTFNLGTIFKINIDGTGFSVIHNFSNATTGTNPRGSLVLENGLLYGQAGGGTFNKGLLFSIHTDGSNYVKLYEFNNSSNYYGPIGNLILTEGSFPSARAFVSDEKQIVTSEMVEGDADIFPNPFNHDFTVMVKSSHSEVVSFNVTNSQSQQLQKIDGVTNQQYHFGESLSLGLYILKIVRGNNVKHYRVLKK